MRTYFCETELPQTEIKAGISGGTLQFWRVDADGRRWFKLKRDILAVPRAFDVCEVSDDDDDFDLDDDDD